MATNIIDRDIILRALYDAGLDEEDLYENYSGRAMYGDKCFGVVGSIGDLVKFVLALSSYDARGELGGDIDWVADVVTDGMGMQSIFYWPGVNVSKEDE